MATYNDDNKTPATGIVGTILGATALAGVTGLLNGNGMGGLFGGGQASALQQQNSSLMSQVSKLESEKYTDKAVQAALEREAKIHDKIALLAESNEKRISAIETAMPLREEIVLGQVHAVASSLACNTANLNASIAAISNTLAGITKIVVPNGSVCPGWGNVNITPATSTTTTAAAA